MDGSEDVSRSSEASALVESMLEDPHFLFTYLGFEGIRRLSDLMSSEDLTLMGSLSPRIAALATMEAGARDALLTAMAHVVVDGRNNRPQRIPVSQVLADLQAALDAADSGSADQEPPDIYPAFLSAREGGFPSMWVDERLRTSVSEHPGWTSVSEHPGWTSGVEHSGRSSALEHLGFERLERLELPLSELLALSPDELILSDGGLSLGDPSAPVRRPAGARGPERADEGLLRALRESMAAGELKREERTLNLPEETYAAGSAAERAGPLAAESCTVCLEDFDEGVSVMRLACGHIYHPTCIREWVCHRATCPSCRAEVVTHC